MAATIEGAFRIIDRASGPMDKMRRNAERLDRALERAGRRLDALGSARTVRGLEQAEQATRNLNRETDRSAVILSRHDRVVERNSRSTRRYTNELSGLERGFRRLLIVTSGIGRVLMALKFPAMGAGIGIVVQAVGALGGGLVSLVPQLVQAAGALGALLPQLAQVGGAAGALPGIFAGVGLAAITFRLSMKDLTDALGGNQAALKRLNPTARSFYDTLQRYKPLVNTLRQSAQGGLFAGLDVGVQRLVRAAPVANALLRQMSATLGGLAARAATRLTTRGSLLDFLDIGRAGAGIVNRGGNSILNLADALRNLMVAAIPFTQWVSRTVEAWSLYIRGSSEAARNTGRFASFFRRTQSALTTFGHILRDVFFGLRNVGEAMNPSGRSMWQSIERAAAAFRRWTASVEGAARIRVWFDRARDSAARMWRILMSLVGITLALGRASRPLGDSLWRSLDRSADAADRLASSLGGQIRLTRWFNATGAAVRQIVGLFMDLGGAIARMGADPSLANTVGTMRGLVPILERILTTLANAFGPPLVDALMAIGRTIENLSGATGPLTIFLEAITTVLNVVNTIIDTVPGLGTVFAAALTVLAINFFISRVQTLARSWWGVSAAATAAAGAEARATGFRGTPLGGMIGGRGGGAGPRGGPRGAGLALWGAGRGGVVGRAAIGAGRLARFGTPLGIAAGVGALGASFIPGTTGSIATGALTGAATGAMIGSIFPGPGTAIGAAVGGLGGGVLGYLGSRQNRGSESDRFITGGGFQQALTSDLGGVSAMNNPRNQAQVRQQIEVYRRFQRMLRGEASSTAQGTVAALQNEIDARKQVLEQMRQQAAMERQVRIERGVQQSNRQARGLLGQYGRRFDMTARTRGQGGAMAETTTFMLRDLDKLRPEGQRILANNVMAWARTAAQRNPALQDQYDRMVAAVTGKFKKMGVDVTVYNGQLLQTTDRSWAQLANILGSHAERGQARVTAAFAAIRDKAVATLTGMGFDVGAARQIVATVESGHDFRTARAAAASTARYQGYAAAHPTGAGGKRDGPGRNLSGGRSANTGGVPPELIRIGRWLQSMGYQVGENPMFGGVHPVHVPGSYHYRGQAIDVNADGFPGGEAAALDRLYPLLARLHPTELLWRVAGHFDHLHLAIGGGPGGSYTPTPGGGGMAGAGPAQVALTAPNMGGGLMGLLGQRAADMYAGGLSQGINKSLFGGWYGSGGDFIARRPTLIGVGDGGSERVTVTPVGGRGGRGVVIRQIVVHNHREGDIQRQIEQEVSAAFHNLADVLDSQPLVGDEGVMS